MKLTIEDNREEIKRYGHVKPAPLWGSVPCSARCPGTVRNCSLRRGHGGPHIAHGMFKRVLAVWDKGIEIRKPVVLARRAGGSVTRATPRREDGTGWALIRLGKLVIQKLPDMESLFLLVLALSMVGFAIDWALRILGWK